MPYVDRTRDFQRLVASYGGSGKPEGSIQQTTQFGKAVEEVSSRINQTFLKLKRMSSCKCSPR